MTTGCLLDDFAVLDLSFASSDALPTCVIKVETDKPGMFRPRQHGEMNRREHVSFRFLDSEPQGFQRIRVFGRLQAQGPQQRLLTKDEGIALLSPK